MRCVPLSAALAVTSAAGLPFGIPTVVAGADRSQARPVREVAIVAVAMISWGAIVHREVASLSPHR